MLCKYFSYMHLCMYSYSVESNVLIHYNMYYNIYILYTVYENILALTPEDVADAVEYAVSLLYIY